MNVAEFITAYIEKKGITSTFGYPGGMVTYLMDSFAKSPLIDAQTCFHEQGAGFAACGYAQASGKVGVAYATSGPGATNLLTPLCHAYFESVPVLFITGQVNTNEAKGAFHVRQKGFQETNIIGMVKEVTKYAAYVEDASQIRLVLDEAFFHATNGRPGPVLLDIPIDVQRTEITGLQLPVFIEPKEPILDYYSVKLLLQSALSEAKRPLIIAGNGINSSLTRAEFRQLVKKLNIPVVTSMIAVDLLPTDAENNYGFIGAYGGRSANFILSQTDLIITIGSRLDLRQTGANKKEFAKHAKLIRIDVDRDELGLRVKPDEVGAVADLKVLLPAMCNDRSFETPDFSEWRKQCDFYKQKLKDIDQLAPNRIIETISSFIPDHAVITTDVGQNQVWVAQSFAIKEGQRVLFSGGHGAMGYSFPASIGAFGSARAPVYSFNGDGGFQMNSQELQLIATEQIPVKIFIINNRSLGMIRHFQEMYFNAEYTHTVGKKGYVPPDFVRVANAYGIDAYRLDTAEELASYVQALTDAKPVLFDTFVGDETYVFPKLAFNKPIYDQEPALGRALLAELLAYQDEL